ncbi:MAG: hypothetical protein LCH93_09990 [Proteobacteria bacterium]|nr:hypothetical protein [Pseudomonadota bacterium]
MFLPTLLAAGYFFGLATDQYESEARFVVRTAVRPEISGSLSFLVQLGLARSQDDSFIVQQFMESRDAVEKLRTKLPLAAMFGGNDVDLLARYPSILYGSEGEEFYRYLRRMISVVHSDKTGISTLRVRAFRAVDARDIAEMLLRLSEELVNRINERLQTDAVGTSAKELMAAQERLIQAQMALTDFRNRELLLDPISNAVSLAELIARLSTQLAETQAQITEMKTGSVASPQLLGLQRKATALEAQILLERSKVSDDSLGLAKRIASYERLMLEREFAQRMIAAAETDLERARSEATRQSLYLERVVEPNLADYSTQPRTFELVLTVFAVNSIFLLIVWLFATGIREHGAAKR